MRTAAMLATSQRCFTQSPPDHSLLVKWLTTVEQTVAWIPADRNHDGPRAFLSSSVSAQLARIDRGYPGPLEVQPLGWRLELDASARAATLIRPQWRAPVGDGARDQSRCARERSTPPPPAGPPPGRPSHAGRASPAR